MVDVNQNAERLCKFSGEVKSATGNSQKRDVCGAQFLSHYDRGAPASVYI